MVAALVLDDHGQGRNATNAVHHPQCQSTCRIGADVPRLHVPRVGPERSRVLPILLRACIIPAHVMDGRRPTPRQFCAELATALVRLGRRVDRPSPRPKLSTVT